MKENNYILETKLKRKIMDGVSSMKQIPTLHPLVNFLFIQIKGLFSMGDMSKQTARALFATILVLVMGFSLGSKLNSTYKENTSQINYIEGYMIYNIIFNIEEGEYS